MSYQNKPQKIGIFGGTFNPIHYGHLIIAEHALHQYDLDQVIFLPTGHAPHKEFMGEEMSVHRYEMVKLAIEGNDRFLISDYEISQTRVNYTYQTLAYFHEKYPESSLYFILGADSLFDFRDWVHPEIILKEAVILAAVRDQLAEDKVDAQIRLLTEDMGGEIHRLITPNFNVSSKGIRSALQNGNTVRYLLPDQVIDYIKENHIYGIS